MPKSLVLPKISESTGCQLGITDRVLNTLVSEVELNRARILPTLRVFRVTGITSWCRLRFGFVLGQFIAGPRIHGGSTVSRSQPIRGHLDGRKTVYFSRDTI